MLDAAYSRQFREIKLMLVQRVEAQAVVMIVIPVALGKVLCCRKAPLHNDAKVRRYKTLRNTESYCSISCLLEFKKLIAGGGYKEIAVVACIDRKCRVNIYND